jgi:hypothetical protein
MPVESTTGAPLHHGGAPFCGRIRAMAGKQLLTQQQIESELSYAYLHAVASRAGFECAVTGRHSDGAGVDAVLRVKERLAPDSRLTHFTIDVQLKATIGEPSPQNGVYAHSLEIDHYEKLRDEGCGNPLILAVLFLPKDPEEWLAHSEDHLIARRCTYWMSLRGAPPSTNLATQTVYIPKENCLSVEGLRDLARRISRGETLTHGL